MTKEDFLKLTNYDIHQLYLNDPMAFAGLHKDPENNFILGFLYARWLLIKYE